MVHMLGKNISNEQIKVIGIGESGIRIINRMIAMGFAGMEFICIGTDAATLLVSKAHTRIYLGKEAAHSFGISMEGQRKIIKSLRGSCVVFMVTGLEYDAGLSIAPAIATWSKAIGALTVAAVTKPAFMLEPEISLESAYGMAGLMYSADTLLVKSVGRLEYTSTQAEENSAYYTAEDMLCRHVKGISDMLLLPSPLPVELRDLKSIMGLSKQTSIGVGEAIGENAPVRAARSVLEHMCQASADFNARSLLMNISGRKNSMSMKDFCDVVSVVEHAACPDVNMLWNMSEDDSLGDTVRVTLLAT